MSEQQPDQQPEPVTLETIRKEIAGDLAEVFQSGKGKVVDEPRSEPKSEPKSAGGESITDAVRREVQKLKDAEDSDKRMKAHEREIAELKKKTEPQPKEYRRITKRMWGSDD